MAVDYVGMDVRATFCESGLNRTRIILLFGRPDPFTYLIAFCSRPEATSDVISSRFVGPVVPDNRLKFGDPRINLFDQFRMKPCEAAFFTVFCSSFRPEVYSDVMSGVVVDPTGV